MFVVNALFPCAEFNMADKLYNRFYGLMSGVKRNVAWPKQNQEDAWNSGKSP